jgi:Heterokaryon incompatibility protein (HET)
MSSDEESSPLFQHQPLDPQRTQIRLLRLSDSDTNTINITLGNFDLEECPPYIALSYMWGPPKPIREISIDGRPFNIRENLWHFLDSVRKVRKRVYVATVPTRFVDVEVRQHYLWIDQICIQQSNSSERNHQVKMMGQIFGGASEVLIWLGLFNKNRAGQAESAVQLCQRPYWRRLWVIQEIMLGCKVTIVHNETLVDWEEFFSGFLLSSRKLERTNSTKWTNLFSSICPLFFSTGELPTDELPTDELPETYWHHTNPSVHQLPKYIDSDQIPKIVQSIFNERVKFERYGRGRSLSYVLDLFSFSGSECENPRDKVYGLLALVDQRAAVEVDYPKTVKEVYYDVLKKVIHDEIYLSRATIMEFGRRLRTSMGLGHKKDKELRKFVEETGHIKKRELIEFVDETKINENIEWQTFYVRCCDKARAAVDEEIERVRQILGHNDEALQILFKEAMVDQHLEVGRRARSAYSGIQEQLPRVTIENELTRLETSIKMPLHVCLRRGVDRQEKEDARNKEQYGPNYPPTFTSGWQKLDIVLMEEYDSVFV